jgi:hypothetical protein
LKTLIPLFLVTAFLGGCAQPRLIEPDPSADIMNAITGRMDRLKQTDADRSEWNKAASSANVLHTLTDLHKALPIGVPASEIERQQERRHLDHLFRTSYVAVHYGFDCDFQAIVFFDRKGRQIYVRM